LAARRARDSLALAGDVAKLGAAARTRPLARVSERGGDEADAADAKYEGSQASKEAVERREVAEACGEQRHQQTRDQFRAGRAAVFDEHGSGVHAPSTHTPAAVPQGAGQRRRRRRANGRDAGWLSARVAAEPSRRGGKRDAGTGSTLEF